MSNNSGYNNSNSGSGSGSNSGSGSGSNSGFNLFSSSSNNGSLGSSSASGVFNNYSWITIVAVIFVLAFLGFNIFVYLAKGTQSFADMYGPYISYLVGLFGNVTADTSKEIINTSATGTIGATDVTANTLTSGINLAQHGSTSGTGSGTPLNPIKPNNIDTSKLSANLNSAAQQPTQNQGTGKDLYEADDSYSSIQSNKSSSKTGWCYIGEDRGHRSCIEVGENDTCMSGDIFPRQDICVNPNLRQ